MNTSTQIQPVNSLTYADVVGLNVGLTRMQGEDSVAFLERCYLSTTCRQDSTYEGEQDQSLFATRAESVGRHLDQLYRFQHDNHRLHWAGHSRAKRSDPYHSHGDNGARRLLGLENDQ